MKVIVDIPERIYDEIASDIVISREELMVLQQHILLGKILSAPHGRLIDEKEVINKLALTTFHLTAKDWSEILSAIGSIETIIGEER